MRGLLTLVFFTVVVPAVNLATMLAGAMWIVGVPAFLSIGYWTIMMKWLLALNLTISMPAFGVLLASRRLTKDRATFLGGSLGFAQASFLTILLAEPGALSISVAYGANILLVGVAVGVPAGLLSAPRTLAQIAE